MMPIGLQVVGSEWNDLTTIAFTKALEKELGYVFIPPNGYD
jgi:Asp-tRNA(Asn)/Glu-tRNA(Gln) amidotransferase A subunit family amidase